MHVSISRCRFWFKHPTSFLNRCLNWYLRAQVEKQYWGCPCQVNATLTIVTSFAHGALPSHLRPMGTTQQLVLGGGGRAGEERRNKKWQTRKPVRPKISQNEILIFTNLQALVKARHPRWRHCQSVGDERSSRSGECHTILLAHKSYLLHTKKSGTHLCWHLSLWHSWEMKVLVCGTLHKKQRGRLRSA